MISKKGKRRIVCAGKVYYWYVSVSESRHRIMIFSEDKKVRIEAPFTDTEKPVTPSEVAEIINKHISREGQ